jgi:hypothetical protein
LTLMRSKRGEFRFIERSLWADEGSPQGERRVKLSAARCFVRKAEHDHEQERRGG